VPTLLRDTHFVLERYAAPAFIRLARTATPLRTQAQAESSLRACRSVLAELDLAVLGILIDWRLAPTAFEAEAPQRAAIREAEEFSKPFARTAVLLLQRTSDGSEDNAWSSTRVQVFHDEEAAIACASAT
jgi:hypothetical protein